MRGIYIKVKLFYYPYGTFAHAEILRMRICWSSPKNKYVNVPSLEVAVSPSYELYHQENSCKRIEKKEVERYNLVVVSLKVLFHTPVPLTDRERGREILAPNSTSCTNPCNYTTA